MLEKIHHINLLVRDLDSAVERYQRVLGIDEFIRADLPGRGVRTARFAVGDSWIVLVQPTDPEGIPGRQLAEHGEGMFLLSLAVASLDDAISEISARGGKVGKERRGLEDWRVADLDAGQFFDAQLQLVED